MTIDASSTRHWGLAMQDTAEFDVRSRAARSRTIPIAAIAICLFIVGMIASAPMAANLTREWPLISRLMPPRGGDGPAGPVTLPGAFTYQQQRPLSCEYASIHIATTMIGKPVSEYEIEAVVPISPNPHWGYRGDIMGSWGNTDDYGVYNEPLASGLAQLGIESEAYFGSTREDLTREPDAGRPVVVWLGLWGDGGTFDAYTADGTRFQLTAGMHVMVAYGYDDTGVYITDPGKAVYKHYDWASYMALWTVMDGMALRVG